MGRACRDIVECAAQEAAVRQGRVDDAPVYETWMRAPGGDVIQRVGVINKGPVER